jgi:nitrite reductase/ring-hydroxylating ferredoxin subunit
MMREALDPRIDTPGREGLTGTAPANVYKLYRADELPDEEVTRAPDGRPMSDQPAWRRDFPIDYPADRYVERRDFMKFMVLTSFAFTAGQFWIVAENWIRRRRGRPPLARIGAIGDVPIGGFISFNYPGEDDACILMRPDGNTLVAYAQKCTHLSCAVLPQPEEHRIFCPCHQGIFDVQTGRPVAGPPRRPLTRVNLEVRGTEIFASGVDLRTV